MQGYLASDVGSKVSATAEACRAIEPSLDLSMVADRFRPCRERYDAPFVCVD